jgi:hypothetical protein
LVCRFDTFGSSDGGGHHKFKQNGVFVFCRLPADLTSLAPALSFSTFRSWSALRLYVKSACPLSDKERKTSALREYFWVCPNPDISGLEVAKQAGGVP